MTVCWHWWRTGDLYVPHRCQQPQGHPGPHICNCNTTTDKETTVTPHPAKPAGYKPFRDPAQIEADARADERARITVWLIDNGHHTAALAVTAYAAQGDA